MSNRHNRTLEKLFRHPAPMNIKWVDIVHMFEWLGADVEVVHGGREKVRLNGEEQSFHIPHGKTLDSRGEVVQIRHFLERAGVSPEAD
ncbi:MAG: type II toxin-antitoxin system HicA family toxin [Planctomycetota bacterium]|jgi:hypothetical protein